MDEKVPLKRCSRCGEEFPATRKYFNKRKDSKDGLRGYCKTCHLQYAQDWEEENPERAAELARQKAARHRKRYPDVVRQRNRKWRAKNRDRIKQYNEQYKEEHDARLRARRVRRRAERRDLPSNYTASDWKFALEFFDESCAACGRALDSKSVVAADHWVPLSDPHCPGTVPGNIVPLCCGKDGCNESKGNNDPEQWVIDKFGNHKGRDLLDRIHDFFSQVRKAN